MSNATQAWLLNTIKDARNRRNSAIYPSIPLNVGKAEIRLLRILPGHHDDEIRCQLQKVSLNDYKSRSSKAPKYEGLSYTWGEYGTNANTITLNGKSGFEITMNLATCLRRLRRTDKHRLLWIDAICINQGDLLERGSQVGLMGQIYPYASMVPIWLGEANEPRNVQSQKFKYKNSRYNIGPISAERDWHLRNLETALQNTDPSWCTRAWVLQEYMLGPKTMLCFGSCEVDTDDLVKSIPDDYFPEFRNFFIQVYPITSWGINPISKLQGPDTRRLIELSMGLNSHDPLDKVYSILSIVTDQQVRSIAPDYTAKCSDVYARTTMAVAVDNNPKLKGLFFFQYVTCHDQRLTDLPTWAIDFTFKKSKGVEDTVVGLWGAQHNLGDARQDQRQWLVKRPGETAVSKLSSDSRRLTLTGMSFDKVQRVVQLEINVSKNTGHAMLSFVANQGINGALHDLPDRDPYHTIIKSKGHSIRWKTSPGLSAVRMGFRKPQDDLKAIFEDWKSSFENGQGPNSDLKPDENRVGMRVVPVTEWFKYTEFAAGGAAFFTTSSGFIGIAPRSIEKDDEIALLYGSEYPVVLRKNGSKYTFNGLAWVDGIMYNELLDAIPNAELDEVQFELE